MNAKIFISVILLAVPFVSGLGSEGNMRFGVTVPASCGGRTGSCCSSGNCKIKYSMSGSAKSRFDTRATPKLCGTVCGYQYNTCEQVCNLLASTNEGQNMGNKVCKCERPTSMWWTIYKQCIMKCKSANMMCKKGCKSSACPLVAKTAFNFSMMVKGTCKNFCIFRKIGASTVKKICNL